jgi:UDP-GlcNAc:undecaprenyl-phosphate/decaprenyl-phosphate GlcNAc-1-phosphate transferase
MNLVWFLVAPAVGSFLIAVAVTPAVMWWYRRNQWLDDPKTKDHPKVVHTYPVPRGGGIPIMAAAGVMAIIFLGIDKYVIGILAGAAVLTAVGVMDDIKDLNPYLRLGLGVVAAALAVAAGIRIDFLSHPWGGIINLPPLVASGLAVVWIVWLMNIVNWSKGVDGQLPGVVVIAAVTIGVLSVRFSADVTVWPVIILAMIVAGAYGGLLVFNVYPQKLMPGYGGGALGGYLLAVLAMLSTVKVGTALVVLGVPLVDAGYVIIRRLWAGKSPVWGDRAHLHYQLLDLGWSKRQIAAAYWLVTAVLGAVALRLNAQQKFYTILMVGMLLGGFLLWWKYWSWSSSRPGRDSG